MVITKAPMKLCMWNLVRLQIINSCTKLVWKGFVY